MKIRKKKDEIIRKGDVVRIINPEFFIRCGYPLAFSTVLAEVQEKDSKYQEKIDDLLRNFFVIGNAKEVFKMTADKHDTSKIKYQIESAIAYGLLKRREFGGNERKIYREKYVTITHRDWEVIGKKVVKTGIRQTFTDFDPEGDPVRGAPFLHKEQSHIILEIIPTVNRTLFAANSFIEAANVEKVMKPATKEFVMVTKPKTDGWDLPENAMFKNLRKTDLQDAATMAISSLNILDDKMTTMVQKMIGLPPEFLNP